jgi:hypothetical protein
MYSKRAGVRFLNLPSCMSCGLVLTYFIGITDINKQNNSNSTIGFRNKQMLFLNLFPMKSIQISQTNIYAC